MGIPSVDNPAELHAHALQLDESLAKLQAELDAALQKHKDDAEARAAAERKFAEALASTRSAAEQERAKLLQQMDELRAAEQKAKAEVERVNVEYRSHLKSILDAVNEKPAVRALRAKHAQELADAGRS